MRYRDDGQLNMQSFNRTLNGIEIKDKHTCRYGCRGFNRTLNGIEIDWTATFDWLFESFNRTLNGIEIYMKLNRIKTEQTVLIVP